MALAAFTTFLDSQGLLAKGSSSAVALADVASGLGGEFVTAMQVDLGFPCRRI